MWTVDAREMFGLLGGGGEKFTSFVDALIWAEAFAQGLPASCVHTNQRVNQPDGGVDTHVTESGTGWLDLPTCWQYKATAHREIGPANVREELSKPSKEYARSLIQQGRAYRFVICDSVPDEKVAAWVAVLEEEIKSWAPEAPAPLVVTADDLAAWASRFPGVVARFFRPALADALDLRAWGRSTTYVTPTYVPVETWSQVDALLRDHLDFTREVSGPVLPILGEAGVGKTRLVYQVLSSTSGADGLVVFTEDEAQACSLARAAATRPQTRAVIVADECSLQGQETLRRTLRGHTERLRVVAIHNEDTSARGVAPRPRLSRIPEETLRTILRENFPDVPEPRRDRYVRLSGGFVRIAADLCSHNDLLSGGAPLSQGLLSVRKYYSTRLREERDRDAVGLVALVNRVGFRDDVAGELEQLCEAAGSPLSASEIRDRARHLKDSPGFLTTGGRYLYVTPQVIASVAFEDAWERWVSHDLAGFLQRLPTGLISAFQGRVAASAPEGVREQVSAHFQAWASSLTPGALTELGTVQRLEALVDTHPTRFLPILDSLVQQSDELKEVRGRQPMGGWGPRRTLVWLMERVVALPECYHEAESILFRLALNENEHGIGNNATEIWRQIQRPFFSGTAVPFQDRLNVLERRVFSTDPAERALAGSALSSLFPRGAGITRRERPPVVAGRVPPRDWRPRSRAEHIECTTLPLELLLRMREGSHEDLQRSAIDTVTGSLYALLGWGYLSHVREVVEAGELTEDEQVRLVNGIDELLRHRVEHAVEREHLSEADVAAIREWREALGAQDFRGRLKQLLSYSPWDRKARKEWSAQVEALAGELQASPEALEPELDWLGDCGVVGHLGYHLGHLDERGALVPLLIDPSRRNPGSALAQGYLAGLLESHPGLADQVNAVLDALEADDPEAVLSLALASRVHTRALDRVLRLVDQGSLPPRVLAPFSLETGGLQLAPEDVVAILDRLRLHEGADPQLQAENLHVGLELLSFQLQRRREEDAPNLLTSDSVREAVWQFLVQPGEPRRPEDSYHWQHVVTALAEREPERAAAVAADALAASWQRERDAVEVLLQLNQRQPESVVLELGRVLLDPDQHLRLIGEPAKELVAALDVGLVEEWLGQAGVEGARQLASALSLPHLNAEDELVVPALTASVLERFGNDERTVREFCLGAHSGRIYSGDIAGACQRQAEVAERFLGHALPAVREWARYEHETSLAHAASWRRDDEEERALEG